MARAGTVVKYVYHTIGLSYECKRLRIPSIKVICRLCLLIGGHRRCGGTGIFVVGRAG
jgi:hypothetical protein